MGHTKQLICMLHIVYRPMATPYMLISHTQPRLAQGHEQGRGLFTYVLEGNRCRFANEHGRDRYWLAHDHGLTHRWLMYDYHGNQRQLTHDHRVSLHMLTHAYAGRVSLPTLHPISAGPTP